MDFQTEKRMRHNEDLGNIEEDIQKVLEAEFSDFNPDLLNTNNLPPPPQQTTKSESEFDNHVQMLPYDLNENIGFTDFQPHYDGIRENLYLIDEKMVKILFLTLMMKKWINTYSQKKNQ
mgnify:CR=1 FL=1